MPVGTLVIVPEPVPDLVRERVGSGGAVVLVTLID